MKNHVIGHIQSGGVPYPENETKWVLTVPAIWDETAKSLMRRAAVIVGADGIASFNSLTKRQILDSSKLKESADDNFKFDESGRMFSKRVDNTVGKGEIAHYEQFLLFPHCFQKTYTSDT